MSSIDLFIFKGGSMMSKKAKSNTADELEQTDVKPKTVFSISSYTNSINLELELGKCHTLKFV